MPCFEKIKIKNNLTKNEIKRAFIYKSFVSYKS